MSRRLVSVCKWESCEKQVLFLYSEIFCVIFDGGKWDFEEAAEGLLAASVISSFLRLFAWGIESREKSPLAHDFPRRVLWSHSMMIKEVGTLRRTGKEWSGGTTEQREKDSRRNRVFLYKMQNNGQTQEKFLCSSELCCRERAPREREKKTDRRIYLPITSESPLHCSLQTSVLPPPQFSWDSQPPEEFFRLFQKEFHSPLKLKVWKLWDPLLPSWHSPLGAA